MEKDISNVQVSLETDDGQILALPLDSKDILEVQLEAGEFFYEVNNLMCSVRCDTCGQVEEQKLTARGCLTEEWDLEPWADCETFMIRTNCSSCGSPIQADIALSWYNYEVRFVSQRTENCTVVEE